MAADGKPTKALIILDKSGGGQAVVVPVKPDEEKIPSGRTEVQLWPQIRNLRDYAATVMDNKLYIIGGFDMETRRCTDKVWR